MVSPPAIQTPMSIAIMAMSVTRRRRSSRRITRSSSLTFKGVVARTATIFFDFGEGSGSGGSWDEGSDDWSDSSGGSMPVFGDPQHARDPMAEYAWCTLKSGSTYHTAARVAPHGRCIGACSMIVGSFFFLVGPVEKWKSLSAAGFDGRRRFWNCNDIMMRRSQTF
jgi:hypothetical protein